MTPDQAAAVAIAKRVAKELGRRPKGNDLWKHGIAFGARRAFQSLQALLIAADLAQPAAPGRPGFTKAEEAVFLRMWEAGAGRIEMSEALGVGINAIHWEVADRGLTRPAGPRRVKGLDLDFHLTRRCLSPACGQITQGHGPCQHCGEPGLTNAA